MHTLNDVLQHDARANADSLPPEMYRSLLAGATPIFREANLRRYFPAPVLNDPGVRRSRHIKIVDLGDALHGESGTGGTFDRIDLSTEDEVAYAIWKNGEVPWRDEETSQREGMSLFRETGQALGEKVVMLENTMLLNGLGPVKGITNADNIQTFAGTTWGTAGNAYEDVSKAVIDKMAAKNIPEEIPKILFCNHAEKKKLFTKDKNTRAIDELKTFVSQVVGHSKITAGKAYVMAASPNVVEYRVYQDLTVVPLPKTDEDPRVRVRVIGALHKKKPDGIVEITGIA